jgi:hypothetical protein
MDDEDCGGGRLWWCGFRGRGSAFGYGPDGTNDFFPFPVSCVGYGIGNSYKFFLQGGVWPSTYNCVIKQFEKLCCFLCLCCEASASGIILVQVVFVCKLPTVYWILSKWDML